MSNQEPFRITFQKKKITKTELVCQYPDALIKCIHVSLKGLPLSSASFLERTLEQDRKNKD